MNKNLNWRNAEYVTFSEMKTLDKHKVDFKMIKDEKTLEPKKKSRTCSSLICQFTSGVFSTGVFIFGKIKHRVIF